MSGPTDWILRYQNYLYFFMLSLAIDRRIQQTITQDSVFVIAFVRFSGIKKAELRCELVRACTVSRYEQFETSLETIEQEFGPAVC